jgi:hypothetical protein
MVHEASGALKARGIVPGGRACDALARVLAGEDAGGVGP